MRNSFYLVPTLLGLFLLSAAPAFAQAPPPRPDTVRVNQTPPVSRKAKAEADSAKRTERLFGLRLTRPAKAGLLAAIAPGAGQIYNKSWWKLPLVYGALGGVGYGEYFYQTRFNEFVKAEELVAAGTPIGSTTLGPRAQQERSAEALQRGIQFYRGYRDIFILYCALAYGMQVLDAVVDAHLKDFDVSDDLSLHWEPTLMAVPGRPQALPTAPGVMFALKVK